MRKLTVIMGLFLLALALPVHAEPRLEPAPSQNDNHFWPLPVHVGGRVSVQDAITIDYPYGPMRVHQWPGTYYETAFTGPEIYFAFWDSANIYRVTVDNAAIGKLIRPGNVIYRVTGLVDGEHRILVERLTETQGASASFNGFDLPNYDAGAAPPPQPRLAPRARQIEFIGDSDMVGYGSASTKRNCTTEEVFATTDTSLGYTVRVAKHYDADYQINAYSGIGVVRNYDGATPERTIPRLYPRALFDDPQAWDRTGWNPQVIVIGMGGNDFATDLKPGEKWPDKAALRADWEQTFITFVKGVPTQNPGAYIVFAVDGYFNDDYLAASKEVFAALAAQDKRMGWITNPRFENTACNWHHSQADYEAQANLLIAHIDALPDIWSPSVAVPATKE